MIRRMQALRTLDWSHLGVGDHVRLFGCWYHAMCDMIRRDRSDLDAASAPEVVVSGEVPQHHDRAIAKRKTCYLRL